MKQTLLVITTLLLWLIQQLLIGFLLLAGLLYIPAVQNFLVDKAASSLSESLGMEVSVESVRLSFPLDLDVQGVVAREGNDTLMAVDVLRIDVPLKPLFSGQANVDEFTLLGAKINTKHYIPDTRVSGTIGSVALKSHGVDLNQETVMLDLMQLSDARLCVALSDTAAVDTTTSAPTKWRINMPNMKVDRTAVALSMPGDSMRFFLNLHDVTLKEGVFDLGAPFYGLERLQLSGSAVAMGAPTQLDLPVHLERFLATSAVQKDSLFTYLVDSLSATVDSLSYDQSGTLLCGIRGVALREHSGLRVSNLSGSVYMDSVLLSLPAWNLSTPHSRLSASVQLPWEALEVGSKAGLRTSIEGSIGSEDIQTALQMAAVEGIEDLLPQVPLNVQLVADGNMDHLHLLTCKAELQGLVSLAADGDVLHLIPDSTQQNIQPMSAALNYQMGFQNMRPLLSRMGIADTTLRIPNGTSVNGTAAFKGNDYKATARMKSLGGNLSIDAATNLDSERYKVALLADGFPLSAFLPTLGTSDFSGSLTAEGLKFDPTSPRALTDLKAQVDSLRFSDIDLNNLKLAANIAQQQLDARFSAYNTAIEGEGTIQGNFINGYHLNLDAIMEHCSLQQLAGAKADVGLGSMINIDFDSDEAFEAFQTKGSLCYNHFDTPERSVMMKDIFFDFASSPDTTTSHLNAGNMTLAFATKGHISTLGTQITPMLDYLSTCSERLRISHDTLRTLLPGLNLTLHAGNDNPMTNILRAMGYTLDTVSVNLATYPEIGLTGDFMMKNFHYGTFQLDNATATLSHNDYGIKLSGQVINNARRNPNKFALAFRSYLLANTGGLDFQFKDEHGNTGFDVGVRADVTHEGLKAQLYPQHPKIAFRSFEVNRDNFVFLGNNKQLQADLRLRADDGTGLQFLSESTDSLNDITLNIQSLNLKELSEVLPYMPKMGGLFNADLHVADNHETISATGIIATKGLEYEGSYLGNIGADVAYLPTSESESFARVDLTVDGDKVMECSGTYEDTEEGRFEGDARLKDLPLALINGFLAGTDIFMKGTVQGGVHIDGTLDAPRVNGDVRFADSHVYSSIYGFDFRMDEKPIRLQNTKLLFENFNLSSTGNNPLTVNGKVDMSDMSNMKLDIAMRAKNFELINAKRKLNSVVYGKAYVDFDCTVRGNLDNIIVRGDLDVLNRTNVSYVLKESPLTVDDQLEGLVQFVSFEDTTTIAPQSLPATNMDLTLNLGISEAANFYCGLSDDGKSYVDVQGGGDLTLRMTQQGEMRLIGRLTIEEGEMKYTLPIIPLKTFKLSQGSYVEFTGDVANPTLNIQAKERMKSVVTENDQQRSVAFDVGVAISKTLEDMGLEFTVAAPEDMGIQNQLTAMTPAQRSKVAVSLMATGLFLADGYGAKGGMQAGSALNAFLQSEIQNIAGSALKTVDINFGIENSTTQTGASQTDYSFQFSKRFFNDRFAVNIGGKVSTGQEADNSAASFIDNITLEYRLDKGATRYVQVFYDRSNYDPLEGQLTKMGTGVVLRKKTNKLGELFIFK